MEKVTELVLNNRRYSERKDEFFLGLSWTQEGMGKGGINIFFKQ